jgi:TPR repeat protein
MGFNVDGALADYKKAVELKPDYGEAHYALAFMYAMGDREKGVEHFKKAMALGVPDERNLGEKFYSNP